MAAVTVLTEAAGVNVVRSMAGGTGSGLPLGRLTGEVTGIATDAFVGAGQRKVRCLAVIELPVRPAGGVVAGCALAAHGPGMMVIVTVAVRALVR